MTNGDYAELLALAGDTAEGHFRRALRRAARKALSWPMAVEQMLAEGRPLTELEGIGPVLARRLREWGQASRPTEPALRAHFLSLDEARARLRGRPDWSSQLRGDLHCHTDWSDGTQPLEVMAEAAVLQGHEYLAITDHAGGLKIARGLDAARLNAQWQAIDEYQPEARVRLLRSVELNLSPKGRPDLADEVLAQADILIGAFHSSLRRPEDQTERYLAALEFGHIHVLAHPQGRIYNYRSGLRADWDIVCERAAELGVALEIDCYPTRQDMAAPLLASAARAGTMISLGSDAHSARQLEFLTFGLAATLEAGIPPERILNFMSCDQLLAWVHQN
ncbi:MAG: PHP domain-containing protein [Vulcanimicrobiota bacterium]